MFIARVIGDVVAVRKQRQQRPRKRVLVQPLNLDSTNKGDPRTALDPINTKIGDCVLVTVGPAGGPESPGDLTVVVLVDQIAVHPNPASTKDK